MLRLAIAAVGLMLLFAFAWNMTNDKGKDTHRFFGADRKIDR